MAETREVLGIPEDVRGGDYVLATYYLELDPATDPLDKAASFAVGQTLGTWVEVPGISPEMVRHHRGRLTRVLGLPPADLSTQVPDGLRPWLVQVALPTVNFGASLPMLLTTLLGNDASTSVQAKLVDVELPDSFVAQFPGPRFGIEGMRALTGVHDRPLLLNMIKPCTGLSPAAGAEIFRQTALGGIDLIKDDELLASPDFSPVEERVRLFTRAAREVAGETGVETVYLPNVTDRPDRVLDTARRAIDAGARALMINFAAVGYGVVEALAEGAGVPVFGHYASAGMFYEGPRSGMASMIALGTLPRLAGADLVLLNTPYGGYPMSRHQYLLTAFALSGSRPHLRPSMPLLGGGVHPGLVHRFVAELGHDIALGAGGAIQGHPDGPAAGVRAMRRAVDAAVAGVPLHEAAGDDRDLATAVDLWGER